MKVLFYSIVIALFVYSCGAPAPETVVEEEVISAIQLYNNFVSEKADSCALFKEDYEACKTYIDGNSWQNDFPDSNTTALSLAFISYYCNSPQNTLFLRYEQITDNAPIDVMFRSGDFDFSSDAKLICGYLDTTEISEIADYVLKFSVDEDFPKILNSKYIVVAQNIEYNPPVVEPNGTYSGGYSKELVYIYDRDANKMFYAYDYETRVGEEISYSVEEGGNSDDALNAAVYESFQGTISYNIKYSFKENNISIDCIEDNQFVFNYFEK